MLNQKENPEFTVSWSKFEADVTLLSKKLKNREWRGILALTRGGLAPAALLSYHLNILNIDTFCVSSYNDRTQNKLKIIKEAPLESGGEGWLIIDDLSDTGKTIKLVKNKYPNAHVATLYAKPSGKKLPDVYVEEFDQNCWIVFPWEK